MPFFIQFWLSTKKCHSWKWQLEMWKLHFKKYCHHIYLFCQCTARNKDIAQKFCMHVVCMHFYNIYSISIIQFFLFYEPLFKNSGQNKKDQNPIWPFCRNFNLTSFDIFGLPDTSNMYVLETFKHLPFFLPKMVKHDVTKGHLPPTGVATGDAGDVSLLPQFKIPGISPQISWLKKSEYFLKLLDFPIFSK